MYNNFKYISCTIFLLFICSSVTYADKLVFASELIRHGQRTPHIDLPNLPNTWSTGVGQLTSEGILQEYDLGKRLKTIYIDKYKLLPANYNLNDVYVRSSSFDRTLMSAHSVLNGMYYSNCNMMQVFAIHSVPIDIDSLLLGFEVHKKVILNQAMQTMKVKDLYNRVQSKFSYWSKVTNSPVNSLKDLVVLGDALYIRQQLGKELPRNISEHEIRSLNILSRKILAQILETQEIGAIAADDIINDISGRIKKVVTKAQDAKKFVLYSGHDVTILALLSALGKPLDISPQYASHVSIQLFKSDQDNNNYYLKFLLNDKQINLPNCKNAMCSLAEFEAIVARVKLLAVVLDGKAMRARPK